MYFSPNLDRFSVDVFQPPFHSGRTSPESSRAGDLAPLPVSCQETQGSSDEALCSSATGYGDLELDSPSLQPADKEECAQASAPLIGVVDSLSSLQTSTTHTSDLGFFEHFSSVSCCSFDPNAEKETSCEKTARPEGSDILMDRCLQALLPSLLIFGSFIAAAVTGYQHPSELTSAHASQFFISLLDSNSKEQRLDEKGLPFYLNFRTLLIHFFLILFLHSTSLSSFSSLQRMLWPTSQRMQHWS